MDRRPIYLDYHATTPVDPRVLESMLPYFSLSFGNPASRSHLFGWEAAEAVEIARRQVASLLKVKADDVYFTSGATEGLNLAIKGAAEALQARGRHIITVATEHHAVLDPLQWLIQKGYEVTILPVQPDGMLEPDILAQHIRDDTIMVIVMWANNETGVIHPIQELARHCQDAGIVFISDITQAAGKIPVYPGEAGIHMACLSSHKFYGPKGTGAIYIDPALKRLHLSPLIHGGGHEKGLRSGTLNVPAIVGFGAAAAMRIDCMQEEMSRLRNWRDAFESLMLANVDELEINGCTAERLPTVSSLKVRMVDSEAVMSRFRTQLAISSGSACSSANAEPSHVLMAMGLTPAEAKGSFRVSLGSPTTEEEWKTAAQILTEAIAAEREISPVWQMHQQGIDVSGLA